MNVSTPDAGPRRLSAPAALLLTLLGVGAAHVMTLVLADWIPHTRFALFYAAVMVAAWAGGIRMAILATVASLVLVEVYLYPAPIVDESPLQVGLRAVLLGAVALGAALLVDRLAAARREADVRRGEAERLGRVLADQAQELELQASESEAMASELEDVNQQLQLQGDVARRAATRSDRLLRVTGLLLETTGEAAAARVIASEARTAVEARGAVVAVVRDEGRLEVAAAEGCEHMQLDVPSPLVDVVHTGEPLFIASRAELAARYPAFAAGQGSDEAWAALPLQAERRQHGGVLFCFDRGGEFATEDRAFMHLLAQQCAQALERARLHETTFVARVRAEFAERRLAFLADASATLSESLDYQASLAALARLAVPDLADWCVVHVQDVDDLPRLVAIAHTDDEQAARLRELEAQGAPAGPVAVGVAEVLRQADVHHVRHITDQQLRDSTLDGQYEILKSLHLRSILTVPIIADERVFGTITLLNGETGRSFSDADVTLALELGRRAGTAVQNARLYQAAQYASEAKSDFLAVMSHELRTPLNAIIGYADLLLLGVPNEVPDRARRQVERIRSASNSLLHLVEEVLSFSRIEAGKEEIRISPVDVSALLAGAVEMIEPMAAEKSLGIALDVPEERLKIVSDERKIRQILMNLLSNAVKFTEEGDIRVSGRIEGAELCISVSDTGIGIPAEHLERIFDPFWQVEQSATRRFGGTGLGLGVARKLARLLEGTLVVESEVGRGSTFTLRLPRRTPGTGRQA